MNIKHLPIKRLFDIFFSSAVLLLGLPLFLVIALIVKLTSPGSAIYSHWRIGRGGIPFRCYKFRTMYTNADARLNKLLAEDPIKAHEWNLYHKLKNDPRITPIGSLLRKSSLDELPQFWNVLIGDLSVVGPRPVVTEELTTHFGNRAEKILSVRPGLTGLWQVSGRNNTSYAKRVELDTLYVEQQSFWLDITLICKTIPCLFSHKGAY